MPGDEREASERLDRVLDRLAGSEGSPDADDGLDPALAETARHVGALYARAHPPAPDPVFVQRVGEDLMQRAMAAIPARPTSPHPASTPAMDGRRPRPAVSLPLARPEPRRPRLLAEVGIAAVLFLTLASGYVAYRLAPSNSNGGSSLPGGAATAATTLGTAPNPAECTIPPRPNPPGVFPGTPTTRTLLNRPAGASGPIWLQPSQVPTGQPAGATTIAEITATIREFVACENARDSARIDAFYSDDYRRRVQQFSPRLGGAGQVTYATPGPLPPDLWQGMPSVEDVRRLPDDRVGAVVLVPPQVDTPGAVYPDVYIFAKINGRWLIDERTPVNGPTVEIAAIDFAFSRKSVVVPADTAVTIRLHNAGAVPHNLTIPGLGVRLDVRPGQTRDVTVKARPGQYQFFSELPGQREAGMIGTIRAVASAPPSPTPR